MSEFYANPLFGITLTILAFCFGVFLNRKTKSPIVNPLLIAIIFVITILKLFDIPLQAYNNGGNIINMFIGPATAVLGYSIYKQVTILKKYLIPIVAGCFVGSLASVGGVYGLCKLLSMENTLLSTLIPKSVTTAIAVEISEQLGGVPAITVAIVIITGVLGAVSGPFLIKIFHIDHEVAQGVAFGTASHAVGTSKALELGEVQGAMSGIAIGVSGIITVILSLLLK
nr:LrgB family protein [uncultured Lachnoclostridium sp.]